MRLPSRRSAEEPLRAALKALEAETPEDERFFATVVEGAAAPLVTVFYYPQQGIHIPDGVEGWLLRDEAHGSEPRRPVFWRAMPFTQGGPLEPWAAEVADAVRALLRTLA